MSTVNFRTEGCILPELFKKRAEALGTYQTQAGEKPILIPLADVDTKWTHVNHSQDPFDAAMAACASAIGDAQFKTQEKSAIVFNKTVDGKNPEFICALISDYDEEGDNYFYNITYDPESVNGISNVVNFQDWRKGQLTFADLWDDHYLRVHNIGLMDKELIPKIIICVFEAIRDYLDTFASETEIVEVVITGSVTKWTTGISKEEYLANFIPIATAAVEVIKGTKHFSIQFGETLKAIAKSNNDKPFND